MTKKEIAELESVRGYSSIADFYERYWTFNGKPAPLLRKHQRELLDAWEAAAKKPYQIISNSQSPAQPNE